MDGRSVRGSAAALGDVYLDRRPGDPVELEVLRGGSETPVVYRAILRSRTLPTSLPALVRLLLGTTVLFPFVLLAVALPVLFYRLEDRNAWLLAALFLCLAAAPGFANGFAGLEGGRLWFARAYHAVLGGLLGASFYGLFAVFPDRSPLERRAPWLKWALLAAGLAFGFSGIRGGDMGLPAAVAGWLGEDGARRLAFGYGYGAIALGLASLLANAWRPQRPDARRKIQVVAWGTAVGVLPATTLDLVQELGGPVPDWLMALGFVAVFAFPLSFGYAVVVHRVLELPVLLKRSARYVLVRRGFGVLLVLLALAANALFALSFTRLFEVDATLATSAGVGFGLALASISAPGIRRATGRIDRAFFRDAYDARVVLEELAARIRTVSSQRELGELLGEQVQRVLRPRWIVTYFAAPDGRLRASGTAEPAELPRETTGLADLVLDGRPRDFARGEGRPLVSALAPLAPDYLVPCVVRGELVGLVVLGPRLSEEPYSGEDWRLLGTVAAQAAVALDNLGLAARMAERIEAERRAGHEMELARQVQAQLLPREGRRLRTLECEGRCVQARAVGGDYFDFIGGSEDRLGLVLADVSGKGFAAALLMRGEPADALAARRGHPGSAARRESAAGRVQGAQPVRDPLPGRLRGRERPAALRQLRPQPALAATGRWPGRAAAAHRNGHRPSSSHAPGRGPASDGPTETRTPGAGPGAALQSTRAAHRCRVPRYPTPIPKPSECSSSCCVPRSRGGAPRWRWT